MGVFTSVVSNQEFQDLVLDRFKSDFSAVVIEYYEANGTLLGIERFFRTNASGDLTTFEEANQTGFILALPNGGILLGEPTHPAGTFLNEYEIKKATAIVHDSKTIAYLITINPTFQPNPQEQRYIETTNKAMLYASLFAITLAVVLGLIFTRTLLKPLSDLSTALSKMEQGKLSQTVEKSSD